MRTDDCNVDTNDDVPHTNLMNQYAFSYCILDSKEAPAVILPSATPAQASPLQMPVRSQVSTNRLHGIGYVQQK